MGEAIELVFIPAPAMGHLVPLVEAAKLLLKTRQRLSITVLIMKLPVADSSKINSYIDSLLISHNQNSRLKLIPLPQDLDALKGLTDMASIFRVFFDSQKANVRDYVNEIKDSGSPRLAGFVMDTFCTTMMDVADEFGLPSYVFYTAGAAMLGLHLHLQTLRDDHAINVAEFKDSDPDLNVSTYSKPFPVKLLPNVGLDGEFLDCAKRIRQAKGVIVNTFYELEPYAFESLSKDKNVPPLYPLGPILNLDSDQKNQERGKEIFKWLDDQPDSSVVFLCFGSGGTFPEPQVKEIADALERSGQRFLWALRKPNRQGSVVVTEYNNLEEILPEGFLERTKSIGKVIGWAPQAAVLAHPSVGGFVSHCGWNSTLESIWYGVPMATWPMSADQHGNAFLLIEEIGMAVEIKIDYRIDSRDPTVNSTIVPEIVNPKEIEIGITSLMDPANSARIKAKEVKEKSRKALEEGGSFFNFAESFFENVMNNLKLNSSI